MSLQSFNAFAACGVEHACETVAFTGAVFALAHRCADAVEATPAMRADMFALAMRATTAFAQSDPSWRLWLGQLRAFVRRAAPDPVPARRPWRRVRGGWQG